MLKKYNKKLLELLFQQPVNILNKPKNINEEKINPPARLIAILPI